MKIHNQDIDNDNPLILFIFLQFYLYSSMRVCLCMAYLVLCNFISCASSCIPKPQNSVLQRSLMLHCYNHTQTWSLTIAILHLYNFVISRMLYKLNHTLCNLWRLTFFLSIIPWRSVHCWMYQRFIPFYCCKVFYGTDVPVLV